MKSYDDVLAEGREENAKVYVKRVHIPFEGHLWGVFLHGTKEHFGTYQTKKSALLDCKHFNLKVVAE